MLSFVRDRLVNLVTGLGTAKDKSAPAVFGFRPIGVMELEALYRSDWLARKCVDLIPFDMTRAWRDWQASEQEIEKLEAEEKRLNVRQKVSQAMQRARLYGGAALFLGTAEATTDQPLIPDRIGAGGLLYLHVFSQQDLVAADIILDPLSPYFGQPSYYEVCNGNGQNSKLHPSRIIPFVGAPLPGNHVTTSAWGDSILQVIYDAVQNVASSQQHVAALLPEMKTDIISVPRLSDSLATDEGTARVQGRFAAANLIRSMHNVLLLEGGADGEAEKWEQKQITFAQMPDLLRMYLQVAAGAADVPVTRMLGQSPAGLSATGDADTRNYYDHVGARQTVELAPLLDRIDEVLIRSALGSRPSEIHYTFAPLWQLSEVEKAQAGLQRAQATQIYATSGLIPDPVLEVGLKNQLVEAGTYPGIESAYDEYEAGTLDPIVDPADVVDPANDPGTDPRLQAAE